jgi:LysR family hydrogen peroxide-inducible transcriptional activator
MPTLSQLQYVIAVEKYRHFGKAAKACHVTQPTLSQQLQKIEDEIGIILFDRTKKPILPTPEGLLFLDQAKVVIREHEKLLHVSKQTHSGMLSGDFKLAVIPTVASYLLPHFLKPFSKTFSKIQLFIEEMKTETILSELANDHLDAAILATPIQGQSTQFKTHPLYYEPFYAYFSAHHELLKHSQISRTQLDINQMWLLQDGHCFKDQVLNYCALPQNHDAALNNIHFRSGSLDTLRRLVQSSQGYTLIPALMAVSLKKDEQNSHVRPFKTPVPTREISLIYRRDHWKLAMIRAIEDTIAQNLPKAISQFPDKTHQVLEVC